MIDRRLLRVAVLVVLITTEPVLPARAAASGVGATAPIAAPVPFGSDFATSLTGAIPAAGRAAARTVRLDVRRTRDDKSVQLALDIRNAGVPPAATSYSACRQATW